MSRRRPIRSVAVISVALAVLIVGLIGLLATRSPSEATAIQSPLVGSQAPATSSLTLGGQHLSLSNFHGRPVILDFFASWCPPCQKEAAQLQAFAYDQSRQPQGAAMLGVVFNDANDAAARFVARTGTSYPVLRDAGGSIAGAWGVSSPPTTFLIDRSGKVAKAYVGPLTAAQLDAAVASLAPASGAGG